MKAENLNQLAQIVEETRQMDNMESCIRHALNEMQDDPGNSKVTINFKIETRKGEFEETLVLTRGKCNINQAFVKDIARLCNMSVSVRKNHYDISCE